MLDGPRHRNVLTRVGERGDQQIDLGVGQCHRPGDSGEHADALVGSDL
jgi:hypothetical protein